MPREDNQRDTTVLIQDKVGSQGEKEEKTEAVIKEEKEGKCVGRPGPGRKGGEGSGVYGVMAYALLNRKCGR